MFKGKQTVPYGTPVCKGSTWESKTEDGRVQARFTLVDPLYKSGKPMWVVKVFMEDGRIIKDYSTSKATSVKRCRHILPNVPMSFRRTV